MNFLKNSLVVAGAVFFLGNTSFAEDKLTYDQAMKISDSDVTSLSEDQKSQLYKLYEELVSTDATCMLQYGSVMGFGSKVKNTVPDKICENIAGQESKFEQKFGKDKAMAQELRKHKDAALNKTTKAFENNQL